MFFDVHTHGAMGHDVMRATPDELATVQRFLATRGVAHYLPTTVTTSIDATIPAGSVISCTPASGTMVAPGSAVAYVVSTGPVARGAKKE